MYTVDDKTEAVKTVQRYLGNVESGIYDNKTRNAVMKFQSENTLEITGVVDYETFNLLKDNFFSSKRSTLIKAIAPSVHFPIMYGESGSGITALNSFLGEALSNYTYNDVLPKGRYYNVYTSMAVLRLRQILGLNNEDLVDEELYSRIERERLTQRNL